MNDKIKSSLSFLSNKNIFVEVLETIGSIDLIDKVLIKELLDKEQYILIDAIEIVKIVKEINDIDKINLFITNNQFYKFTEFSKDDFIETNIYFKNFEIVFIFLCCLYHL